MFVKKKKRRRRRKMLERKAVLVHAASGRHSGVEATLQRCLQV